jgi:hypothetical protein
MQGGVERHIFRCRLCRSRTRVEITIRTLADQFAAVIDQPADLARRPVDEDTGREIERTLAVVRCPTCARRDPRAVTRAGLSAVGHGLAVFVILGGPLAVLVSMLRKHASDDVGIFRLAVLAGLVVVAFAALVVYAQRPRFAIFDARVRFLESTEERGGYRSSG